MRKWSQKELDFLKNNYANKKISLLKLSNAINRTIASIETKAWKLKLNRHEVSKPLKEIIKMYRSGLTCSKISKVLNCSVSTICRILARNNISQREDKYVSNKIYELNQNYFDNINSQDKAYFLGFIYADGNIYKNRLSISLVKKDRDILDKFIVLLEANILLASVKGRGRDKPQYRLVANSKHLADALKKYGAVPRKSLILVFPKWLKANLYSHFIRGYFDGDGSISISAKKKDYKLSFCGTKEFLNYLQKILYEKFGIKWKKLYRKKRIKVNSYSLTYTGRIQVEVIMSWMYYRAKIWMNRKKERYTEIKRIVNASLVKKHYRTTMCFLNNFQIKLIRKKFAAGGKPKVISKKYNVSQRTIENIVYRSIPKYQKE